MRWLARYSEIAYALLRLIAGLMFAMHGSQKLLAFPPGPMGKAPLASIMGLAGAIELVGGLMIALGFFAGVAAFIASGEMAFAYFTVHAKQGFLPIVNQGELAVLFCFVFLYIATRGSGRYALDQGFARKP